MIRDLSLRYLMEHQNTIAKTRVHQITMIRPRKENKRMQKLKYLLEKKTYRVRTQTRTLFRVKSKKANSLDCRMTRVLYLQRVSHLTLFYKKIVQQMSTYLIFKIGCTNKLLKLRNYVDISK